VLIPCDRRISNYRPIADPLQKHPFAAIVGHVRIANI
jgi:hypothetical protein